METKLHPGRHFILYAQGHYRHGESLLEDLRVLVADYIGGDPSGVSRGDILWVVWKITFPFLLQKKDLEYARLRVLDMLVEVLVELFEREEFSSFLEQLVSELLSTLAQVEVLGKDGNVLLDLGSPDYNLLPKLPRVCEDRRGRSCREVIPNHTGGFFLKN